MIMSQYDFHNDIFTSPDATISEILKEIKKKQAEISSDPGEWKCLGAGTKQTSD